MSLCCELSGGVPVEPVVTSTGHLFEKRLIEAHLEKNGTCPITGKSLSRADLIALSPNMVKRPSALFLGDTTSLLTAVQTQVDSLMVDNYRLTQERDQLRKEVTHMLYMQDSATRLVAQKLKEIEGLQKRIETLEAGVGQLGSAAHQGASEAQILALIGKWETLAANLLQTRKKRGIKARDPEELAKFQVKQPEWDIGSDTSCFDLIISGRKEERNVPCLVATGTATGKVCIRSLMTADAEPVATLAGHTGPVTALKSLVFPSLTDLAAPALAALQASSSSAAPFQSCFNLLSGSEDGCVRHWAADNAGSVEAIEWLIDADSVRGSVKLADPTNVPSETMPWACQHVFKFDGPVRAIDLHPSGTHAGVVHADDHWTLIDLTTSQVVCSFRCPEERLAGLAFQPDGMVVLGASTSNRVPVWDMRTREVKAALSAPSDVTGTLTHVAFSESGYQIVTSTTCAKTLLWDLRKSEVTQTLLLPGAAFMSKFDNSGKHIVSATEAGLIFHSQVEKKKFSQVHTVEPSSKFISCQFDKLSDDFCLALSHQGTLTCVS